MNKWKKVEEFHNSTKIDMSELSKDIDIALNPYVLDKIHFKTYPRFEKIKLKYNFVNNKFEDILLTRRSFREFSNKEIELDKISKLLRLSAGITFIKDDDWNKSFRSNPSAGARYPLEIYLVVKKIKDLKPGIYHYDVKSHQLEFLWENEISKNISKYFDQEWVEKASVIFIITSVFDRTLIKYGDRGYRYVLFDAGHLVQNLYLVSNYLDLAGCAIGGFCDDKLNEMLDIVKTRETVLYAFALGTR
ncbi:MAG: SagB/ThcOx family dehydrogenase [Candidatus Aenigmarchaeota archaeon]|nr:SagB/ThcOx family dehydrogenase [Candidatus Aenigmarchaeota archaeon]